MFLKVSPKEYRQAVISGKVLVKLSTVHCAPCRVLAGRMAPVIGKLEEAGLKLVELDAEEAYYFADVGGKTLLNNLVVSSTPTLILYEDGKELRRMVGLKPVADVLKWIEGA